MKTIYLINSALTVPIFMLSGAFWNYDMMSQGIQKIGNSLTLRLIFMEIEKLQAGKGIISTLPIIVGGVIILLVFLFLLSLFLL